MHLVFEIWNKQTIFTNEFIITLRLFTLYTVIQGESKKYNFVKLTVNWLTFGI